MLKATSVIFIACLALVGAKDVVYKDCGSKESKIVSIDVSNCSKVPCILKRNTKVNVTVNFKAGVGIKGATNKVYGIIGGLKVPFPEPKNACDNMPCPVKPGATVTYKNDVFVNPHYPEMRLIVQWEVIDSGTGQMVFCFLVPVQIQ